jgi:hypothetical protein
MKKINLKRNDILKIGKYKYVVYKIGKKQIELLPIDEMLSKNSGVDFVPNIRISKEKINPHQKLDNFELFLLINQKNPLIRQVVERFLDSKEKR